MPKNGFSLVELAIVLVIIGLITGGILTGQDLIRASEMNSAVAEVNKIKVATNTFKLKYNKLPGDLNNATSYWPSATTANGNGSGQIDSALISGTFYESSLFPQHLSLAGLIPGSYPGTYNTTTWWTTANTPGTDIANTILVTLNPNVWSSTAALANQVVTCLNYNGASGASPVLGCQGAQGPTMYNLFAADARSIDAKIDDGSARTGKVLADSCHSKTPSKWGFDDGIIYQSADTTLEYDLTNTTSSCGMMFIH